MSLLSFALLRPAALASSLRSQAPVAAAAAALQRQQPRRWAGHSRWQNVKADKQAGMAQRSSAAVMFKRLVQQALAKGAGSANPQTNVHLKAVFDKAKAENFPLKSLERVLAARSNDSVEPYAVEVRGRGGICVLVQCNSPTKIKCRQEVASFVKRVGLEVVGVDSQVSRGFFDRKGCVEVSGDPEKLPSLDAATELALECDCADVRAEGDAFVFECEPAAASSVAERLRSRGLDVLDFGVRYEALDRVPADPETSALLQGVYERMRESLEGFVQVFDNLQVQEE